MPQLPFHGLLGGQKALVTGASSGLGRAIALALAEAGADVAVNFIGPPDAADDVVSAIRTIGSKAIPIPADVSQEVQVQTMFKRAIEELGTIDILVNNAGIQSNAPVDRMTIEQWNSVIGTNLTGQFLCAREAIREFKRRGIVNGVSVSAGKIICISSVHEVIPWAGHVNYAASKGGVMLLMKSIAQEMAALKIRVNSICPGAIRTPMNESAWENRKAYDNLMTLVPYKRIGEPEEIGRLAVFLASDYADYITGASVYVDGGMILYSGFETGG
ncbi:MAG: 3-oxoacyl-ACP reductase FabG [Verrucomicrobia bacterium]|nr:3-oxoacyl-ACP reductase FabG [Verrucomicrobiota bacterium]